MKKPIIALQIGGLAGKTLVEGCTGKVMGITSRGVFLNTGQRILFVTDADYHSPFNIQLTFNEVLFDHFTPGEEWSCSHDELIFPNNDIHIDTSLAKLWQPANAPIIMTTLHDQSRRMDALLQRIISLDPGKGWIYLASPFNQTTGTEAFINRELTDRFLACVKKTDLDGALEAGRSILGRGGGLTPSGDDWLSGFVLYFARTGQQNPFIINLGESLTDMAYERTTKISANRIEAACLGWSEELFLEIIDAILVTDAQISDLLIERIVSFGHSSGVDTCVGIRAALEVLDGRSIIKT